MQDSEGTKGDRLEQGFSNRSQRTEIISIYLLGKTFSIKCPADKIAALQRAAIYLEARLTEMRTQGGALGLENMAILAALHVSYELLIEREHYENSIKLINSCANNLQNKIDNSLKKLC